jgi:gliding motility-associated-like protein
MSLQNGDSVFCIVTNTGPCSIYSPVTSNKITIQSFPPVAVSLGIIASYTTICPGDTVLFTASAVNGGLNPNYLWQLNGIATGSNNSTFITSSLSDGDQVSCILTSTLNCTSNSPAVSNIITIHVSSITINASSSSVCKGEDVLFVASAMNTTFSPGYQWLLNGNIVGAVGNTYSPASLSDGDLVECKLTGNPGCPYPVISNIIAMNVNPLPIISMGNDTLIEPGRSAFPDPLLIGHIIKYQWTPATGLDNPVILRPKATPNISTTYFLTATSDKNCKSSGKIRVVVYYPLQMPNAFTPNGDGKNDLFRIPSTALQQIVNFSIFNRWGERIFFTTDRNVGWEGNYKGKQQPIGSYIWQVSYVDLVNKKLTHKEGTVLLLR